MVVVGGWKRDEIQSMIVLCEGKIGYKHTKKTLSRRINALRLKSRTKHEEQSVKQQEKLTLKEAQQKSPISDPNDSIVLARRVRLRFRAPIQMASNAAIKRRKKAPCKVGKQNCAKLTPDHTRCWGDLVDEAQKYPRRERECVRDKRKQTT